MRRASLLDVGDFSRSSCWVSCCGISSYARCIAEFIRFGIIKIHELSIREAAKSDCESIRREDILDLGIR